MKSPNDVWPKYSLTLNSNLEKSAYVFCTQVDIALIDESSVELEFVILAIWKSSLFDFSILFRFKIMIRDAENIPNLVIVAVAFVEPLF